VAGLRNLGAGFDENGPCALRIEDDRLMSLLGPCGGSGGREPTIGAVELAACDSNVEPLEVRIDGVRAGGGLSKGLCSREEIDNVDMRFIHEGLDRKGTRVSDCTGSSSPTDRMARL